MARVILGRALPTIEWSEGEASDIRFFSPPLAPATSDDAIIIVTRSDVAATVTHGEVESKNGFHEDQV
jgi:hypothetical protein